VASPNHTHTRYTLDAMGHGKPVLCEKPMATTLEDARQMTAAAARSPGLSHGVGFNYRYLPAVEQLRTLIATDRLGQLHFIDLAFKRDSALTRAAFTWRDSDLGQATSGALGDLGIHLIDLVSFLTGSQLDAGSCRLRLRTNVPLKEGREVRVDDDAYVSGRLLNGTYINLTASKSVGPEDTGLSMKIIAEHSEFVYHSRRGALYHLRPRARWEVGRLRGSPPLPDPPDEVYGWAGTFHAQIQEWAGLVVRQEQRRQLADISDGLRAQAVLGQLLV
jgi:glucose-6-phosphate 3-dehydrogenase